MEILAVTVPIFLFLLGGFTCRQRNLITEDTVSFLSKMVFYVSFPAMMFRSVARAPFHETFQWNLVAVNVIATIVLFLITVGFVFLVKDKKKRGAFHLTSFRSNQGYMGLPVIFGFYGYDVMARAAIVNGFDALNVIVLSVISLEFFRLQTSGDDIGESGKWKSVCQTVLQMLKRFITNPFIIASAAGLVCSYFHVAPQENGILDNALVLVAGTALPLSLLMVGASIQLRSMKRFFHLVLVSAGFKLILAPTLTFFIARYGFGLQGDDLGMSVMLLAMPSAISSYVMVRQIGSDESLCAAAIGFSTIVSVMTISVIQYLMRYVA